VIRPPPKVVRRVLVAPAVVLLCVVLLALSPFVLAGAALLDLVLRGRGFGLTRLAAFGVVYVAAEAVMIVAFFLLWIGSGFGLALRTHWMRSAHFAVIRWWLHLLSVAARLTLGLRIVLGDPPEVCGNGIDEDLDGLVDEEPDLDRDGDDRSGEIRGESGRDEEGSGQHEGHDRAPGQPEGRAVPDR